jgi:hypothetical protein
MLLWVTWSFAMGFWVTIWPVSVTRVREDLQAYSFLLNSLALLTCVVLTLWVIFGRGLDSQLWRWLPPFVFFRWLGRGGRGLIVGLLVLGTLLGMFGQYLGIPQQ